MYWLTEDMSASWQHAVISFDLGEESFAKIQLPEEREDTYYLGPRKFWIRDIDGKICIVTAQPSRYDPRALLGDLQIWTLENTVELQRWSKKYNIKNPPNYIPGPHFVHMDRIISQPHISVCSYELFSENFEIDLNKKVKLFDSRPRWLYNMQAYICVKSLVSLDVYKKAAIVRRSKQQVGWELKKWQAWEDKRREVEDIRSWVHKHEHVLFGKAEKMGKMYQHLQDKTHVVAGRLRAELNQVLRDKPDNPSQPKSPRRLNWVEQKRDNENLMARSTKLKERIQVMKQAHDNISSIIASLMLDKCPSWGEEGRREHLKLQLAIWGTSCYCLYFILGDYATLPRRLLSPWIGCVQPLLVVRFSLLLRQLLVVITFHFQISSFYKCSAHNAAWQERSKGNSGLALNGK